MMEKEQLYNFLKNVNAIFPIALTEKVCIDEYTEKLFALSDFVTHYEAGQLVGLVAGYITNSYSDLAYIALAAVLPESQSKGIGRDLVLKFIEKARAAGKSAVHLYAVRSNIPAMKMYERIGFEEWVIENESRPDDVHLIYRMKK